MKNVPKVTNLTHSSLVWLRFCCTQDGNNTFAYMEEGKSETHTTIAATTINQQNTERVVGIFQPTR